MRPSELVPAWVEAFNRGAADAQAAFYAENAVNHQVAESPVAGRAAIRAMLADRSPGWPAAEAHVHVYVADVDDSYRRAIAAGAVSIQEPVKKKDADRRCGVKEEGGSTWWIATKVE